MVPLSEHHQVNITKNKSIEEFVDKKKKKVHSVCTPTVIWGVVQVQHDNL